LQAAEELCEACRRAGKLSNKAPLGSPFSILHVSEILRPVFVDVLGLHGFGTRASVSSEVRTMVNCCVDAGSPTHCADQPSVLSENRWHSVGGFYKQSLSIAWHSGISVLSRMPEVPLLCFYSNKASPGVQPAQGRYS
jgi:hypothetical protein